MKNNRLLFLSLISSILVILIAFFQWKIINIVTEFLMGPIWLFVFGFFLYITVLTVINLFKNKDWKPFTIQIVTILLWLYFPFTEVVLDIDFKINKLEREEIVRMVESGTLKPRLSDDQSFIQLPKEDEQLSDGGEIMVEKNSESYTILFFTYRGISDSFSGFVYSPNDQKPSKNVFSEDFKEIEKLDRNWYWVSSY